MDKGNTYFPSLINPAETHGTARFAYTRTLIGTTSAWTLAVKQEPRPCLYQLSTLLKQVATTVSRLALVLDRVCQGNFDNRTPERPTLRRPIPEPVPAPLP